jgi:hypothetical protein
LSDADAARIIAVALEAKVGQARRISRNGSRESALAARA